MEGPCPAPEFIYALHISCRKNRVSEPLLLMSGEFFRVGPNAYIYKEIYTLLMKKNLLLLFLFSFFKSAYTQTVYENYIDGKVYVKLTRAALKPLSRENPADLPLEKLGSLRELIREYGISRANIPFFQASDDEHLPYVLKLEFTQKSRVNELIRDLRIIPGVEYAEKVSLMKTDATTPNDFAISSASVHLAQINAQNAWDYFNGNSNITVAIVDNAVMWSHADLVQNAYTNALEASGLPGVDDDGNGYIDDIHGYNVADDDNNAEPTNINIFHGTLCAGVAGARTDNGIGVASIGWNIKLIPVQCEPDNTSSSTNVSYGYEGIIYAVRAKARIISCSWGNQVSSSQTEQYVIDYAWNRGSIVIASAGNSGNTAPIYPGSYNHVYCVAAVDPSDIKWSGSNYGSWVDISAPGTSIMSTMPYIGTPAYAGFNGTSFAAPMVAGLAGLMLSKSPAMTRNDVLNCISGTAANIYTLGGNTSFLSGNQLGAGRIDAQAAMACAANFSVNAPVANFYAFLPNTCPNTLIPFTDSSLYNPTSWNWTFQGGTPATSTLSNPSVMWSTPGTYSVSLTVSNTNGSTTKTKLAYITVSGPSPLPFSEGFQNTTFLPAGWTANNIWNDNLYWQRKAGIGGFGTSTACAMFDNFNMNAPGEHDEMRSPKFDLSNTVKARLRFDVAYARYDAFFSDTLEVKLSTDCGSTWTSIYLKGGTQLATAPDNSNQFIPTALQWRRDTIDISSLAAGQGVVMFSFLNRGHYGQPIYLDNINLAFPSPTLGIAGTSVCAGSTYTFSNTSTGAASYSWNFQGASPATSTLANPAVSYASPGTYTLSMTGVNGTSTVSVTRTVTASQIPTLNLSVSPSASVCAGSVVTFSASGAGTYSWSTGSTNATSQVTAAASSIYTVYGSNQGCISSETIALSVAPFTISVSASSPSVCSGGSATLTATGANSYTWQGSSGNGNSLVVNPSVTTVYALTGSSGSCSGNASITIAAIPLPVPVISASNAGCAGSCDGRLSASSSGGSAPFSYSLSGNSCNTLPCTSLCAGAYTLYTQNAEGCSSAATLNISSPAALQSITSVTNISCAGCSDGALAVTASGGTSPYSYTWSPSGGNGPVALNLSEDCYTVTIGDANGCSTTTVACVLFSTGLKELHLEQALLLYPNPAAGEVTISLPAARFSCTVYNALGQLLLRETDVQEAHVIQLGNFAKGIYTVEIKSGRETARRKLIVE